MRVRVGVMRVCVRRSDGLRGRPQVEQRWHASWPRQGAALGWHAHRSGQVRDPAHAAAEGGRAPRGEARRTAAKEARGALPALDLPVSGLVERRIYDRRLMQLAGETRSVEADLFISMIKLQYYKSDRLLMKKTRDYKIQQAKKWKCWIWIESFHKKKLIYCGIKLRIEKKSYAIFIIMRPSTPRSEPKS